MGRIKPVMNSWHRGTCLQGRVCGMWHGHPEVYHCSWGGGPGHPCGLFFRWVSWGCLCSGDEKTHEHSMSLSSLASLVGRDMWGIM